MQFSSELMLKYKEYMLRIHKVEITDSQAQLDLASLSGLYVAFAKALNESAQKQSLE